MASSSVVKKVWTQSRIEQCSYVWTVENFSRLGSGSRFDRGVEINSDVFTSAGENDKDLNWRLRLYIPDTRSRELTLNLILLDKSHLKYDDSDEEQSDDVDVWSTDDFGQDEESEGGVPYKVTCSFTVLDQEFECEHMFVDDNLTHRHMKDFGYRRWGDMDFPISKGEILDNPNFPDDDDLIIFCKLSYKLPVENAPEITADEMENNKMLSALSLDFGDLYSDPKLSDVAICVGDTEFPCHKLILSTRSPVFAAMFQSNLLENKENRVEIKDLKQEIVNEMLQFIYTGKAPNVENIAEDLLIAADRYDVVTLKALAEGKLISKLSVKNVVDKLMFSDTYCATTLKSEATDFMVKHLKNIKKTSKWRELAKKNPGLRDHVLEVAKGRKK